MSTEKAWEHVPWLHVRGQFSYHGEAYIVGTRAGLLALREAIDRAIEDREAEATVYANDGEGYALTVRRARSCGQMGKVPYMDELAREMADYERQWAAKHQRHNWNLYQKIKEQVALRDRDAAEGGDAKAAPVPQDQQPRPSGIATQEQPA